MTNIGRYYFLILLVLIIVAFYVGFAWDTLAIVAAASRVARELVTGAGATSQTSSPTVSA